MDKETLSSYGWIVVLVLVLSVLLALATPFGNFIKTAVQSTTQGLFDVSQKAGAIAGLDLPDQKFNNTSNGENAEETNCGIKFYQPYRYTMTEDGDESIMEYVFHENGAVDAYMFYYGADGTVEKYGESMPEGTCTYDNEWVYVGGEPALQIGPNGSHIEMDGEGTFTLAPTQIKYLQYGETYVNDWIVEEDYPYMIFSEDGSAKYYGDGGAEQSFPSGTFIYKDRYIEFNGENCAVYPDGTKVIIGDILLEIGCAHLNTEIKSETETETKYGDLHCKDCGMFIKSGGCKHINTEIRDVGQFYTGDTYCQDCNKLLITGEKLPCDHLNTELLNKTDEYTGDEYCKDCGELVKKGESLLITFYVDDYNTYNALKNMTWEQWVNSKYNTAGWYVAEDTLYGTQLDTLYCVTEDPNIEKYILTGTMWNYLKDYDDIPYMSPVLCDEIIRDGYHYIDSPFH